MRVPSSPLLAAGLGLALAACGGRGDLYTKPLVALPALTAGDAVVLVLRSPAKAVVARAKDAPRAVALSGEPRAAVVSEDGKVVAVVSGTPAEPRLELVDPANASARAVALPAPYDAVALAPDGRHALLSYSGAQFAGLARNPNEIAVVAVETGAVARVQLATGALAPAGVLFSPVGGTSRLVAVLFEQSVAVLDAAAPEREARRISIRPQGSSSDARILEALFSRDGRRLFLRASGHDDVIVVELEQTSSGLQAALNFVTATGLAGLTDIEVPLGPSGNDSVFALYGSREVARLDARGLAARVVRLPLRDALTKIHALPDGRALCYDGTPGAVTAWDPASGKSGTEMLAAAFDGVTFAGASGHAVFHHPGSDSGTRPSLSVVAIEEEMSRLRVRASPILLSAAATTRLAARAGGAFYFTSGTKLGALDLRTLEIREMELETAPAALLELGTSGWLAATQFVDFRADLTFVPAAHLTRAASRRITDLALVDHLGLAGEED